jgi:hypothetical protein
VLALAGTASCGQGCLSQIEAAPEDSLVRTVVAEWYRGKARVYCGERIAGIDWLGGQRPALLGPDRKAVPWVRPEKLPGLSEMPRRLLDLSVHRDVLRRASGPGR